MCVFVFVCVSFSILIVRACVFVSVSVSVQCVCVCVCLLVCSVYVCVFRRLCWLRCCYGVAMVTAGLTKTYVFKFLIYLQQISIILIIFSNCKILTISSLPTLCMRLRVEGCGLW